MIRIYKYKLYNTKRLKYLNRTVDIAGIIYNHCISLHKRCYRLFGKSLININFTNICRVGASTLA